ncbi:MAG: TonB-dependent receptor domain-containing protein, partial [Salinibacter sp.]
PENAGQIQLTDVLPSLNLVYELAEKMNLRAAATRTLARPTFREIAPYPGFDFIQGERIIGNPDLNRTLISNLDLRWEWFPRPGEVLAASVYYKRMDEPIERAFIGSSSNTGTQLTWKNVDEATLYGAEFEARVRLDRIAASLRHVTVGGNLSLTRSRIDVPCLQYATDRHQQCIQGELYFRQVNNQPSTRNLQGQSPYLVNLNLQYDDPESGTSAGVFYGVFGERLSVVSSGSIPDVYTQPRPSLTASFSREFFEHWTVELKAENLLNSPHRKTYSFQGQDFPYQTYRAGRSFTLGISYAID